MTNSNEDYHVLQKSARVVWCVYWFGRLGTLDHIKVFLELKEKCQMKKLRNQYFLRTKRYAMEKWGTFSMVNQKYGLTKQHWILGIYGKEK